MHSTVLMANGSVRNSSLLAEARVGSSPTAIKRQMGMKIPQWLAVLMGVI